jgi:glycosyltransferase involved in cell wall biosynthesis
MALVFISLMGPRACRSDAMACGMPVPVIGVREAGIRESVVDGITGVRVDREPIQIAAAIVRIQQKEMCMRMSRREVEDVLARWRWEYTVDWYEEEVQKLFYTREHAAQDTLNSRVLPNNLRTNN